MKYRLQFLFLFLPMVGFPQQTPIHDILSAFITAHNNGEERAVKQFIEDNYHPELVGKMDISKHIAFYRQIIGEFGPLHEQVYHIVEESEFKLIVHLIKKTESLLDREVDPAHVLVVEIDSRSSQPQYLARGLGLGALICEVRKETK